jgi:nucleoside-diphosphate-sugar epimerase
VTGALQNPASYGKSINLGSGKRLSINYLADAVLSAFERTRGEYPVNYAPGRSGEQRHVEADNIRAHQLLGWQPRVPFETGLAETVQWSKASMGMAAGVR